MKRNWTTLLALVMVVSLLLTACGGGTPAPAPAPEGGESSASGDAPAPAPAPAAGGKKYTMVTGSSGGTYFALGGAMANTWNSHLDGIEISSVSSGASVENMNLLQAGEADLGISMNNIADFAWNGTDPFTQKYDKIRCIGVVYHEVYQIVASAASGVKTLEDIKGKRFEIGPPGSGTAVTTQLIFDLMGIDPAKDLTTEQSGFGDAAAKMQDGHLDVAASVLTVPASSIIEMTTSMELNYIDIPDDLLAQIQVSNPFYSRMVIPAGTYSNTEDFNTITCEAALYVRADMSEDEVYQITKEFYENAEEIAAAHSAGKDISLEGALNGITTPVHKGAAKYYEEKGIAVPAELIID